MKQQRRWVCYSRYLYVYVLLRTSLLDHSSAGNTFASTHSLDENPFEDPVSNSYTGYNPNIDSRAAELDRRQAELDAREAQIRREQEQLSNARKNGRNNWPPCMFTSVYMLIIFYTPVLHKSLPINLPWNRGWDSEWLETFNMAHLLPMVNTLWHTRHKHDCLYLYPHIWLERWGKGFGI